MQVLQHFQLAELPRLAVSRYPEQYPFLDLDSMGVAEAVAAHPKQLDLAPLSALNLTLCYGKEWYRFPGHFLVPTQVNVGLIRSEHDGALPTKFLLPAGDQRKTSATRAVPLGVNDRNQFTPSAYASQKFQVCKTSS